jgi:hypothetical protein
MRYVYIVIKDTCEIHIFMLQPGFCLYTFVSPLFGEPLTSDFITVVCHWCLSRLWVVLAIPRYGTKSSTMVNSKVFVYLWVLDLKHQDVVYGGENKNKNQFL